MSIFDVNGVPICEGDLLRTPHYRHRRGKRLMFLYHVVQLRCSELCAVPITEALGGKPDGGVFALRHQSHIESEIIDGPSHRDENGHLRTWNERKREQAVTI